MSRSTESVSHARFSWIRDDLESRLGFHGGRFTRVNNLLWFLMALVLTGIFYAGVYPLSYFGPPEAPPKQYSESTFGHGAPGSEENTGDLAERSDTTDQSEPEPLVSMRQYLAKYIHDMFCKRTFIQHVEVFFSFWALCIVLAKINKVKVQRRALEFKDLVPSAADFVLSPATVGQILSRMREECDDSQRFFLFNRIELALSNLKNMGQIGDVDNVLQSQASNDEDVMDSSYALVKGLIWAIPVLGFIGTVYGLGNAIGGFSAVLSAASEVDKLKDALGSVTSNLSTAFDTTFVALVAALGVQLLLTFVRKSEEELLDACKEFCQRHIVGRLRLMPFERGH